MEICCGIICHFDVLKAMLSWDMYTWDMYWNEIHSLLCYFHVMRLKVILLTTVYCTECVGQG